MERAHMDGVLTTTCLMMSGAAAADAVARARRLPGLRVGLHVVLVDGRPVLAARDVPDLADDAGEFTTRLVGAGFKYFFHSRARRQLEAEIRAQFEAFAATGLTLDHVNAHNHMHVHPTIFGLLLKVGREHGNPPVRIPYEPLLPSWRARHAGFAGRFGNGVLLAPFFAMMRARARAAGVAYNEYVFGMNDTGNMTSEVVIALLRELPQGASEMYLHPATTGTRARELAALLDPAVARALQERGIERIGFADVRTP
ncbi:MAG: hopanoid biosynthesis-associated protein HpnK [Candidatus Eremiobacteraeota bacterium]|nr:hopanoid biosynthesis-associated protein HpnK [Candidatus Eremiobacteraeota bacterium]